MIHYSHCPVCTKEPVQFSFSAKDFTVSQQLFPVWKCNACTAMFTQDIPVQESIGAYYASEDYISHSDTQEGLINNLYHHIRKRTLLKKLQLVKNETHLATGDILDVGCGTGAFLQTMKQARWNITGLEPDETARKKAIELHGVDPLPSSALFSLANNSYDAITAWHVMEHVHQLHEYITQCKQLLKSNGKLIIAVPNYTSYDATVYKTNWAAYDVPRHLYHFSPQSMRTLMSLHGLQVKQIKPMWFDSFYVSMLSEKYTNGKGNIIKAFFTGLVSNIKAMFNKEKCSSLIYIISKD